MAGGPQANSHSHRHALPNLEWLTEQREVSLDRWFERLAGDIRKGQSDADARRALDGLIERFNDGHVALRWPSAAPAESAPARPARAALPGTPAAFCAAQRYDAGQVSVGTAAALPGYRAIEGGGPFGAGVVRNGDRTIGVVRIGVFSPQGYPMLCEQAVANMEIKIGQPCDAVCEDRILTEAYRLLTLGLMVSLERLRAAGADVLLVDLTRNGGGSEWAEAAARMVSSRSLKSAPLMVMRDEAWVKRWRDLSTKLRAQVRSAPSQDRSLLLDLAKRADATADGLRPCSEYTCPRLAQSGYASGLIDALPAGRLDGKPWAAEVFSAAQFPYHDGVWQGPVIVLVDSETWSAAEQFTALLRDNDAAIVMGTRTGGAGCGHLYGKVPVTLLHSRAMLELPNCARLRKDGSNEVSGIVADVATGVRWNDGAKFAGQLTAARLPEAVAQAEALHFNKKLSILAPLPLRERATRAQRAPHQASLGGAPPSFAILSREGRAACACS